MNVQSQPAAITVLVVEDDGLVRFCAVDALRASGFHVLEAATGPEALLVLETAPVDVVFTDVNMPGAFDGLGLAWRIRRRWPDVAIVITSGRGLPNREIDGARFVPKPYSPDTLGRIFDEAMGHQGAALRLDRLVC